LNKRFKPSTPPPDGCTLRVAKAAIRTAGKELSQQSSSLEELLALIKKSPPQEGARVAPFLAFLGRAAARAKGSVHKEEITALQNWVIQALGKEMRFAKTPPSQSGETWP